ncbi:hypothetical protein AJ78_08516 [Emergomyces pasteurianus Ep9510]|uniref:Actin-related protein 2/3 complex subunit 3 n=1 Tax=Emergomyces pasteurianus Ep9510 TaxID=1447872 RepID=A0A1J9P108_9EURO|nr:hypothetical protein AJ78_08516 [Emergomyces pasteurianus Ep9510]
MPAYHSIFLQEADAPTIGNFPLLPLRTRTRGPAYTLPPVPPGTSEFNVDPDSESYDCLDEILSLYRANTFFRNFEIKGPADRMLIYGILFVSECLTKVKPGMAAREAEKVLINASLDHFAIPGDASFPLNQAFEPPRDRQDAETLRQTYVFVLDTSPKSDKSLQSDYIPVYTPEELVPRNGGSLLPNESLWGNTYEVDFS